MRLTHEFSETLVGFVVTDRDTGRQINAQFQEYQHGYGDYAAHVAVGCDGDESATGWTDEEQEDVVSYLRQQPDVAEVESAVSVLMSERGHCWMSAPEMTQEAIFADAKTFGWTDH